MFEVLLLVGLIALIGLASRWVYERTRIPEVLLLLLVGIALGPLGLITQFGLAPIDPAYFRDATPLVGAVVIVFLVFDASFRLKAQEIFGSASFAALFALANVVACIGILTAMLHYGLGMGLGPSLLLASIVAGPSTYALRSILPFVRASNYTRNVLYLEGTLSTIIICVIAITLMQYGSVPSLQRPGTDDLFRMVASSLSVSLLFGLALAAVLIWLMHAFRVRRTGYLLTLAGLLVLYYADFSLLGGIGVLSIAAVGFALGNSQWLIGLVKRQNHAESDESFSRFQNEMTLFISTFFFVYLGMIFRPSELTVENIALALLLLSGMLFARLVVTLAARLLGHSQHKEDVLLTVMIPSDLLSATLASFTILYPGIAGFSIELVLMAIAASTLFTSFGVGYYERLLRGTYLFRRELRLRDGRKVTVRSFTKDDIGRMGRFLNEMVKEGALISIDSHLSPSEEREMGMGSIAKINRGELILWVGESNGRIIARASAEKMPRRERDNVSLSFYVAQDFRSAGLGSSLLRMIVAESRRFFKPHNLYLTVYSNNKKAIKLYQKQGFAKVGVLPDWMKHEDGYLDRVYMVHRGRK